MWLKKYSLKKKLKNKEYSEIIKKARIKNINQL